MDTGTSGAGGAAVMAARAVDRAAADVGGAVAGRVVDGAAVLDGRAVTTVVGVVEAGAVEVGAAEAGAVEIGAARAGTGPDDGTPMTAIVSGWGGTGSVRGFGAALHAASRRPPAIAKRTTARRPDRSATVVRGRTCAENRLFTRRTLVAGARHETARVGCPRITPYDADS